MHSIIRLLFIGLCAMAMISQTRIVLDLNIRPGFLDAYVFGGAIFGYYCTHPNRVYSIVAWLAGFAGGLSFLCWVSSSTDVVTALVPLFFWLAYYGFRRPGIAGLRNWQHAKPLTVALAWAWVTVLLPISPDSWVAAIPVFLARTAFVYVLALAYDISDLTYDRSKRFNTLAMRLEPNGVYRLINIGLLVSTIFIGIGCASGVYSSAEAFALLISLIFSGWWMPFLLKKATWEPYHKLLIDALMPLQSILVLLLH